jgi:glycine/D-amino acid oxidase-like deaminating enzyme
MVAPSTGKLVADGITGAALPEWHAAVRADRFGLQPPDAEAQVI